MTRDDLPEYDEREQGLDQDCRVVPESSKERSVSAARYHGSREGLIARLNGGDLRPDGPRPGRQATPKDAEPGPLRAVIYLRVSTEEQAKVGGTAEGYSIPYQRRACREKAEALGAIVLTFRTSR